MMSEVIGIAFVLTMIIKAIIGASFAQAIGIFAVMFVITLVSVSNNSK